MLIVTAQRASGAFLLAGSAASAAAVQALELQLAPTAARLRGTAVPAGVQLGGAAALPPPRGAPV